MMRRADMFVVMALSLVACGKLGDDSCFGKGISCGTDDIEFASLYTRGEEEKLALRTFPEWKAVSRGLLAEQGPLRFGPDGKVWTLENSKVRVFDLDAKALASGSAPEVPYAGTRGWSFTVAEHWAELTIYSPSDSSEPHPPIESTRFTLDGNRIQTDASRHFQLLGDRILNQRIEDDGSRLIAMLVDETYAVIARFDEGGRMVFRQDALRQDHTGYDNRGQVPEPTVDLAPASSGTWVLEMPNRAAARLSLLTANGTITEQANFSDAEIMPQARMVFFGTNDLAIITEREDAVLVRRLTHLTGTDWAAVGTEFTRASESHPTVGLVHAGKDGSVYLEIEAEVGTALCSVSPAGHAHCDGEPLSMELDEIYVDASSQIHAAVGGELVTLTR